ncbi:FlgO family outer membrane protein [Caulobacter sp. KR2-114]|uniref:FlgO family outer membrane protein n=1 Tax=Caulobacter sp. KR2-114 TaxID=3400912 RepID=UPI003C09DC9B
MRLEAALATVVVLTIPATVNAWPWTAAHHAPTPSAATPSALGPPGDRTDLGDLVYLGAQALVERAGVLDRDRPIVVTTMVSIDDFSRSSRFGRLASQLVSNRIAQRGYAVRDVNYMGALMVRPETGELALSRDASRISSQVNAQAVVAGTYTVAGREIYLSMRLIRAEDGMVLSSADVVIPLDHNTEPLVIASASQ